MLDLAALLADTSDEDGRKLHLRIERVGLLKSFRYSKLDQSLRTSSHI